MLTRCQLSCEWIEHGIGTVFGKMQPRKKIVEEDEKWCIQSWGKWGEENCACQWCFSKVYFAFCFSSANGRVSGKTSASLRNALTVCVGWKRPSGSEKQTAEKCERFPESRISELRRVLRQTSLCVFSLETRRHTFRHFTLTHFEQLSLT